METMSLQYIKQQPQGVYLFCYFSCNLKGYMLYT